MPKHGALLGGGFDQLGHFKLLGADRDLQGFEHVLGRGDGASLAAVDESVGPAAGGGEDAAGDGQDFAVLFDGVAGRVQGAALQRGLDDDGGEGQAADDAVALGEVLGQPAHADGILGDDCAALQNAGHEPAVGAGVDLVQAGAPDGDGGAFGVQHGAMGFTINAGGHAADDADASAGESSGQLGGDLFAVGGYAARADDGDGALVVGAGQDLP